MSIDHLEISSDKLTCRCDPSQFGFETTADIAPLVGTLGHDRAISATDLALEEEDQFTKYRINDLVDNTICDGSPIVFEYSPTYYNLFGRIDACKGWHFHH